MSYPNNGYPQQGYPQQQMNNGPQPVQPGGQYPQQQQQGGDPGLYTSSLAKNVILHGQKDARGKDQKQRLPFPVKGSNQSEEISFTLSADRLGDMMNKIQLAMQDPQGTGGVRITLYANHYPNQGRGRPYDGAKVMIYPTRPPQQGFGNRGGSFNRQQPPPPQYPQAAPQGMAPYGAPPPGPQTPAYPQAGPGPVAPPNAFPSNPQPQGYPPAQLPPNNYVPQPGYPPQGVPAPQPTAPAAAPAGSTPPQGGDQGGYDEGNIPF